MVRVPVLSEQMVVALPIVSQASRWRTRLLSLIIFCKKLFESNQCCLLKQLETSGWIYSLKLTIIFYCDEY